MRGLPESACYAEYFVLRSGYYAGYFGCAADEQGTCVQDYIGEPFPAQDDAAAFADVLLYLNGNLYGEMAGERATHGLVSGPERAKADRVSCWLLARAVWSLLYGNLYEKLAPHKQLKQLM